MTIRPHWTTLLMAIVAGFCLLVILFGGLIETVLDPRAMDLDWRLSPPLTHGFLLGSDAFGRDVAARMLAGLRWSVSIATLATLIASVIGVTLGLVAARRESWLSTLLRQITTFTQAFPAFVLAVTVIAILRGNGIQAVVLTLGLITWPVFARVAYAEGQAIFQREYVLAAAMMGMSRMRLYLRHVLPGLVPSLSVLIVFHFAEMIIAESALSFLGIGTPMGAPTWGVMLSESQTYIRDAPWLLIAPAGAIVTLIMTAHLFAQHLRTRAP
ncbi:MAG TPA: ABC transporter permease [Pararhizobium sp.]|uniref:ABC transporter permease n=1 Tax=Pararhizobium sp. TaxID=1977563 RepID=UPI002BBF654C|nr:ABC transporter permease [Pararhizobium sp.]HTO34480.1 ABC transporter permease [Pararhizobium sp.]